VTVHGRTRLSRNKALTPLVLVAAAAAAVVVAALIGRPPWAAALGAGLVLAYWALEVLAWRRGEASGSFGAALGVALGGMVLRLALVLAALVAVGLLASRPAFATAAVSFLLVFTLYWPLRLITYTVLQTPRRAGAGS
jgi:hypothetical protein